MRSIRRVDEKNSLSHTHTHTRIHTCHPSPSQVYQDIAAFYDIPHINIFRLVNQTFLHGLHERMGLTRWQMLARLYMDSVHFQARMLVCLHCVCVGVGGCG